MTANDNARDSSERDSVRTRRQVLAGVAAGVGVIAAESIWRARPAAAANGDSIIIGQGNQASSNTFLNDSSGDTTFSVLATSNGTAVDGAAVGGTGVSGSSETGTGVAGTSGSTAAGAAGVHGEITSSSPGAFSAAVRGKNNGTGDLGIGVYGSQAGSGWGVYGTSMAGVGVYGAATSGVGVEGSGPTGVLGVGKSGVHGLSGDPAGVGLLAENTGGGKALNVVGIAAFTRSGVATVRAGHATVTTSLHLNAASFVLATIQGNVAGVYVQGVTIVGGPSGSFTIHLNKPVAANTKVAWFVVN
jgi:hypothetical protein